MTGIIWHHHRPMSLTHWGWVMYKCFSNLTIIMSDNGLLPSHCHAIFWTSAGMLLIGHLETNLSAILIKIHTFSLKKIHLKLLSAKWQPFCLSLIVLKEDFRNLMEETTFTGDPLTQVTQPNRITHNLAAHHRTAHNPVPVVRWCADLVTCVTHMCNLLHWTILPKLDQRWDNLHCCLGELHTVEPAHQRTTGLCAVRWCAARLCVIRLGCVEGHLWRLSYNNFTSWLSDVFLFLSFQFWEGKNMWHYFIEEIASDFFLAWLSTVYGGMQLSLQVAAFVAIKLLAMITEKMFSTTDTDNMKHGIRIKIRLPTNF